MKWLDRCLIRRRAAIYLANFVRECKRDKAMIDHAVAVRRDRRRKRLFLHLYRKRGRIT